MTEHVMDNIETTQRKILYIFLYLENIVHHFAEIIFQRKENLLSLKEVNFPQVMFRCAGVIGMGLKE